MVRPTNSSGDHPSTRVMLGDTHRMTPARIGPVRKVGRRLRQRAELTFGLRQRLQLLVPLGDVAPRVHDAVTECHSPDVGVPLLPAEHFHGVHVCRPESGATPSR